MSFMQKKNEAMVKSPLGRNRTADDQYTFDKAIGDTAMFQKSLYSVTENSRVSIMSPLAKFTTEQKHLFD